MSEHDWVDRELYPFRPHHLDTPDGRMHYVDEGTGPVVVLVHGTPTWSFLYRDVIRELSRDHRVVAPDHLGFGLSDKPADAPYRPEDHAARLALLIGRLGLEDITLVVEDFGGPIGLSYAIERPGNVRALVLMNTWLWSLKGTSAEKMGRLFSTALGRFLYTRLNFSPRVILPSAYGDRKKLTKRIHRQYLAPFGSPAERQGAWAFARALIGSDAWYESLWQRRDRLARQPALLLWGLKDPAFGPAYLARWKEALPGARVMEFADAGHFVPEEVDPAVLAEAIRAHVAGAAGGNGVPVVEGAAVGPVRRGSATAESGGADLRDARRPEYRESVARPGPTGRDSTTCGTGGACRRGGECAAAGQAVSLTGALRLLWRWARAALAGNGNAADACPICGEGVGG